MSAAAKTKRKRGPRSLLWCAKRDAKKLGVLRMYAQLIKKRVPDPEVSNFADEMIRQVDLFVKMTREILDYSRGVTEMNIESTLILDVVETSLKFIEADFRERKITIARDFLYGGTCRIDPEKIGRVFYNLASNAADAMPDGGTLTIRTEKTNDNVRVIFTDTGIGIPEHMKSRIFEPFFTHGKKHGTGLGLAIVKKIIDDHRGRIEIDSQENVGTTIRLLLPS